MNFSRFQSVEKHGLQRLDLVSFPGCICAQHRTYNAQQNSIFYLCVIEEMEIMKLEYQRVYKGKKKPTKKIWGWNRKRILRKKGKKKKHKGGGKKTIIGLWDLGTVRLRVIYRLFAGIDDVLRESREIRSKEKETQKEKRVKKTK